MRQFRSLFLIFILVIELSANDTLPKNSYSYNTAKEYAMAGNYDSAIIICNNLLELYPHDIDIYILKARIYGWKSQYQKARTTINNAYEQDSANYDVLDAISDIEYWDRQYYTALNYVGNALKIYPEDSLFLQKKQKLESIINPSADSSVIKGSKCLYVQYYFDMFNRFYKRRWQVYTLGILYNVKPSLQLIPEINIGHLAEVEYVNNAETALQADLDAYYISSGHYYLYLNYGYSPSVLFPEHKAGMEYFTEFVYSTEISFGVRYMRWDKNLYYATGSLSKYYNNYWFSFRPYILLRNNQTSGAYLLAARYYMNKKDYAGLGFVFGAAPDQSLDLFVWDGTYKSNKVILSINKKLNSPFSITSSLSYSYEEFILNEYQHRFDFLIRLYYCF